LSDNENLLNQQQLLPIYNKIPKLNCCG